MMPRRYLTGKDLRPEDTLTIIHAMSASPPDLQTMIAELVALPSVSSVQPELDSSNKDVCDRLASWLEDLGFVVSVLPVPDRQMKFNLLARLGEGEGGLVLAGHTDTVPWDESGWSSDPFVASRQDDRVYGLGTADMKSFLALAARAATGLDGNKLRAPLTILATADEESTMSGARALAASREAPGRYALIGEPTGMQPVFQHKGVLMEGIRVRGKSGHSSNPALGRSALEGMLEVIAVLRQLQTEFADRFSQPAFEVPEPTINLGYINGGDNPNRICAECELHVDVRLNPGMTVRGTRALIHERVRARLAGSGLQVEFLTLFEGVDPLRGQDGPLLHACEAATGARKSVCFCTEGPYLQSLGMETVIMGPGSIDQAHQPNEYLSLAQAQTCARVLDGLIHHFCVAGHGADHP
jgi:acetylornithine deacetylase